MDRKIFDHMGRYDLSDFIKSQILTIFDHYCLFCQYLVDNYIVVFVFVIAVLLLKVYVSTIIKKEEEGPNESDENAKAK